ncbi:hypothetical protein [Glycomyces harbinensis]|uniref:Uncharacterized protein n=1 Tax=Glycomyces harbinensis TaxID=58114 RepID=A0A1G6SFB2_9ACTN|nr:hypothetical protein [Glycomyces harbinensis]SDD15610.1 hypothetical protein SAMN05216270_10270 [Glycomyces harbinensis]
MNETPVQSPFPDFGNFLIAVLGQAGIPAFLLLSLAIFFALESWYTYTRKIIDGSKVAGGAIAKGSVSVLRLRPFRLAIALVSTFLVLCIQLSVFTLSAKAGSYISAPFDPDRADLFLEDMQTRPWLNLLDPGYSPTYLRFDLFAAIHVIVVALCILQSYRAKEPFGLVFLMAFPYWLGLTSIVMLVGALALDLLVLVFTFNATGPESWPTLRGATNMGYTGSAIFTLAYTGICGLALQGSAVLKKQWAEASRSPSDAT